MTRNLRLTALAATALVLLGVTGCGSTYAEPTTEVVEGESEEGAPDSSQGNENEPYVVDRYMTNAPKTTVFVQVLPDGRQVYCVWADGYREGGLSCDFDNEVITEE